MAVRPIQPMELLDLADHLAGRGQGPGKPRTIYLRRAISTGYYAIFSMLRQHAAIRLLGCDWSEKHALVSRWVTHTDLAALADAANGRGNKALANALEPVDARLVVLAQNFKDLQDARHGADYDDLFEVTKPLTLSYVHAARSAVTSAEVLNSEREASYARFLGLAVGGVKIAKAR